MKFLDNKLSFVKWSNTPQCVNLENENSISLNVRQGGGILTLSPALRSVICDFHFPSYSHLDRLPEKWVSIFSSFTFGSYD